MSGISGNVGGLDRDQLLALFGRSTDWGTLSLDYGAGAEVILLARGKVRSSYRFGTTVEGGSGPAGFRFEPHREADLPQFASSFPESGMAALRALPALGPAQVLPAGLVDLRAFVARARDSRASGALTISGPGERGMALFEGGRIGAALLERAGRIWERADALRGIYRFSLDSGNLPMNFYPLESGLARSLLGLALERRHVSGDPDSFSGVVAAEGGFTFYCQGTAQLLVSAGFKGDGGRFGQLESVPDLELPDDPPGWESRRFTLTLRGRDALNPMTELAMDFSDQYGAGGRRVLEAVRHGLSIEETAARLELDLQALKPWLERLEQDGMIRQRG